MSVCKMYIRYADDLPATEPHAVAERGLRERGIQTVPFYGSDDIEDERRTPDLGPDVGVAGYIGDVWRALDRLGVPRPPKLDYPDALRRFLGRRLERMSLREVRNANRKMFVKPVRQKLFDGFVCEGNFHDQIRLAPYPLEEECWVSDAVHFVAEYRCFVLRGEVLDARRYRGDWGVTVDRKRVELAVRSWERAPCAYTLDFGVTDDGRTLLVEANDGFALGTYGLAPALYAQMLEARWKEMLA